MEISAKELFVGVLRLNIDKNYLYEKQLDSLQVNNYKYCIKINKTIN